MADPGEVERSEVEAVLEVRRELGPSYEPVLVDSFAEKVERAIESRVAAQMTSARGERSFEAQRHKQQFVLGIISLGTGIPITAVAGAFADVSGIMVAWAGIAAVNVAHALQGRRSS